MKITSFIPGTHNTQNQFYQEYSHNRPGTVANACNSSTLGGRNPKDQEVGRSLKVKGSRPV